MEPRTVVAHSPGDEEDKEMNVDADDVAKETKSAKESEEVDVM